MNESAKIRNPQFTQVERSEIPIYRDGNPQSETAIHNPQSAIWSEAEIPIYRDRNPQSAEAVRRLEAWLRLEGQRRQIFDNAGQIDAVEEPGGSRFEYVYDRRGDLTQIIEANGRRTTYEYDTLRRLIRVGHHFAPLSAGSDGTMARYTYGENDRLIQIDDRGVVSHFEHDLAGRVTRIQRGNAGTSVYRYDEQGRVVEARTSVVSIKQEFDTSGRVTAIRQALNGVTLELRLEYDPAGRLAKMFLPGRECPIHYQWNAKGWPQTVRLGEGQIAGFEYLDEQKIGRVHFSNGVIEETEADPVDARPIRRQVRRGDEILFQRDYHYSPTGQVIADGPRRYDYDPLGRLIQAEDSEDSARWDFSYDRMDNRIRVENVSGAHHCQYDSENRFVQMEGPDGGKIRMVYDRFGRPTQRSHPAGQWTYRYNDAGQLLQALHRGNRVAQFTYDHKGRLALGKFADRTERYLYGPDDELLAVTDEKGDPLRLYVRTPLGLLAEIHGSVDSGEVYFLHNDDRGTCHLVTDPNGEIVARFRYTPFGIPVGHPGCPKDAGCLDTPDKPRLSAGQRVFECNTPGVLRTTGVLHSDFLPIFSGHVWQLEIRMYRFGARWYDPYLGRFLTPDSYTGAPDDERLMHPLWPASGQVLSRSQMLGDWLKHPRSRNRYAYCANDPLNRADPNGHWAFGGVLVSLLTAIWTLPNTLFGLLLEVTCLIGEVVRWLVWLISLGRVTWESPWFNVAASSRLNTFALVFEGGWLGSFSNLLGVTFGNVFFVYKNWKTHPAVTALPEEVSPPAYGGQVSIPRDQVLYEHELRHTVHYGWFGPFFHLGLHYFGVYEWDVILGGFHNAWFERDARYHSEESFTDLPLVTPIVGPIPGDDPTKGSLAIQLIDENDQPVAHTTVLLVNKKEYCVTTNAEGAGVRYCIPPETYTLTYPPQVPATGGIVLELIDEQEQPVSTGAVVLAGIDGREWEASVTDGIARLEAIPPGNYTIFRQEATTGSVELELVDERGRQMSYASIVLSALDGTEQKVEVANGIARQDRISPETYTILLDSGKNEKGV